VSPRVRYASTTLVLLALAAGYALSQGWAGRPTPPPPRPAVRPEAPLPPPPPARQLLDQREALRLSRDQRARLEALDAEWRRASSRLEAAIGEEERGFAAFMSEAQSGRRASLEEIQRRSAALRELSAALREARREHGLAAQSILTDQQRHTQGGVR
jgi:hypothetical protein